MASDPSPPTLTITRPVAGTKWKRCGVIYQFEDDGLKLVHGVDRNDWEKEAMADGLKLPSGKFNLGRFHRETSCSSPPALDIASLPHDIGLLCIFCSRLYKVDLDCGIHRLPCDHLSCTICLEGRASCSCRKPIMGRNVLFVPFKSNFRLKERPVMLHPNSYVRLFGAVNISRVVKAAMDEAIAAVNGGYSREFWSAIYSEAVVGLCKMADQAPSDASRSQICDVLLEQLELVAEPVLVEYEMEHWRKSGEEHIVHRTYVRAFLDFFVQRIFATIESAFATKSPWFLSTPKRLRPGAQPG